MIWNNWLPPTSQPNKQLSGEGKDPTPSPEKASCVRGRLFYFALPPQKLISVSLRRVIRYTVVLKQQRREGFPRDCWSSERNLSRRAAGCAHARRGAAPRQSWIRSCYRGWGGNQRGVSRRRLR